MYYYSYLYTRKGLKSQGNLPPSFSQFDMGFSQFDMGSCDLTWVGVFTAIFTHSKSLLCTVLLLG